MCPLSMVYIETGHSSLCYICSVQIGTLPKAVFGICVLASPQKSLSIWLKQMSHVSLHRPSQPCSND